MIDHYRQQYHCEHGFAWPIFYSSRHEIIEIP
jgi:hypothetical protein